MQFKTLKNGTYLACCRESDLLVAATNGWPKSQKLETMFRASMGLHEKTRTETSPCSGVVACDQRPD